MTIDGCWPMPVIGKDGEMKLILADLQDELIGAWQSEFGEMEEVCFHHGSIFEVECDALVSPANSFGFMDGGIDMVISKFFGWHVQDRLQTLIQSKHHGELLVGTAEIVSTNHPKIPFVISAPTMRVPMILDNTVNVYLATRAVFSLVKHGRFEDGIPIADRVKMVAIPGMGTGVGRVPPEICARQMRQAYEDVVEEKYQFPDTWYTAQQRHQLLYGDEPRDLQYRPDSPAGQFQRDLGKLVRAERFLGKQVSIRLDRPLGSRHPEHGFIYPVNYGYVPGCPAPDGDELDAYVLGVFEPLEAFTGRCIAVVQRLDDDDDKLVVVPEGVHYSDEQITVLTEFQERFFQSVVIRA